MTTWIAILLAALKVLGAVTDYFKQKNTADAAVAEVVALSLKRTADEIQVAVAARNSVRDRLNVDPASVHTSTSDDRPFDLDAKG